MEYCKICGIVHTNCECPEKPQGMTLQKAMNTLDAMQEDYADDDYLDQFNALQLGIEALKRCIKAREKVYFTSRTLLPGETEE